MKVVVSVLMLALAAPAFAQATPPLYPPAQLDELVARVALYPDPLLAQVLVAATFHDQIAAAAHWADRHRNLAGQALALEMQADRLPWDPSVQAMLPFPSVLDIMASNRAWTAKLGDAFLAHPAEVMDAIQRQRRKAKDFGYLQSNEKIVASSGDYITVLPVKPSSVAVPTYETGIVFAAPRPGHSLDQAIHWSDGVLVGGFQPYGWKLQKFEMIGSYFQAWGWGLEEIDWGARTMIINDVPWRRNWANRHQYAHPYPDLQRVTPGQ